MTKKYKYTTVLTIAGSDSGGGAGIQADLKTFSALGCYGMSALTALTAQNTCGVRAIHAIPPAFVQSQIQAVMEDILPDAIKIGMVHTTALVDVIAEILQQYPGIPVVFDPVMVASSGDRLIEEDTIQSIIKKLFPLATLITPNLDEASLLTALRIETLEQMYEAGSEIMRMGCNALLLKGGHLQSAQLSSMLFRPNVEIGVYMSDKIDSNNTHGSGCTLSSAIACYLAEGIALTDAITLAQDYVHNAILHGKDVITGKGHGPLNHFYNPYKLTLHELV
ncbi:bifunctional hydroxymethylpyrimidine kinase/phosphomethylpyrimidine kinase [Arcticibacter eurypsychrophilus]|uniref:bifunctional hydroxymethylpyrimidine kinase/phosphomethylpyrimidine kinase n=1 Tax=Arcticibacter eurypsychrophilus TaxID=1434752 RepID=UPI00084D5C0B|nr:bifunctional hydroxymethylpyrimidine kinase/phosphomethylpyrimidine kinase [Arcticibacter eurypsychrophilus]